MKYSQPFIVILFILIIFSCSFYLFRLLTKYNKFNNKIHILYEDHDILVINKPTNIASHHAPGWDGPTIVDTLLADGHTLYKNEKQYQDGIVHRLDVGTSGIMVMAKNEIAFIGLKEQFFFRTVTKIYHALVEGSVNQKLGTINAPIGLVDDENNIYGVVANGKPSTTYYKPIHIFHGLSPFPTVSLLEINLDTGRTHQIRVHFSNIHHPLVGDTKYGSNPKTDDLLDIHHQWLHAKQLEFNHPVTGKRMVFNTDYPNELKNVLQILSNNDNKNNINNNINNNI